MVNYENVKRSNVLNTIASILNKKILQLLEERVTLGLQFSERGILLKWHLLDSDLLQLCLAN